MGKDCQSSNSAAEDPGQRTGLKHLIIYLREEGKKGQLWGQRNRKICTWSQKLSQKALKVLNEWRQGCVQNMSGDDSEAGLRTVARVDNINRNW